jgi:outer membrane protein OmpA-like peptidoglycan-associated protein
MKFSSGRSDLPAKALPLLSKVSEMARSLNAKEIKIEGHTDSTGTQELNKRLSEERAQAVATYFKSNGFDPARVGAEGLGFEKPVATNKSKEGRAQNRRVDVIITPEASASMSTQ